jgi:lysophospholipase L1-like esterase
VGTRIRIVALGDSTTAGTPGWRSPLEAPPSGEGDESSQYAYWMMKARPDWDVLNRGVKDERTDHIRARFDRDVLGADPRAVVIIAGVNDIYEGRPVEHVTEQLAWMFERAVDHGIATLAGSIIPFNTATAPQNDAMHAVNDWIRRQARTGRIRFVDTRAAVASPQSPDLLVDSPDRLHPSPHGYRLMAEAIRGELERLLTI